MSIFKAFGCKLPNPYQLTFHHVLIIHSFIQPIPIKHLLCTRLCARWHECKTDTQSMQRAKQTPSPCPQGSYILVDLININKHRVIPNSDEQYEGETEADKGIQRTHYIGWPWNISMMKENLFKVRKFILGRGNSKCKGPGRQKCMACLRNRMEGRVARMLWAKFGGQNRRIWNQIYKDIYILNIYIY